MQAAEVSIEKAPDGWRVTSPVGSATFGDHDVAFLTVLDHMEQQGMKRDERTLRVYEEFSKAAQEGGVFQISNEKASLIQDEMAAQERGDSATMDAIWQRLEMERAKPGQENVELSDFRVLGRSLVEFKDGVKTYVSRILDGGVAIDLVEEKAENDMRRWSSQGRTNIEQMRTVIQKVEAATGDKWIHASNDVAVIEAYSALTRLWATGTRKGNAITGAVRSQEASIIRAQRNRLRKAEKDGVAPGLMKKLKETAEFFHQVLKQTARLMKAKKEGKLGDIEEFLNESVGLSQQAAHVESLEVVAAAPEETAAGAPGIDSASDFQQRTRLQEVLNGQSGGVTFSLTLKNLDEARIHLRGLSGKPMTTADGLTANISNQTAAKMVSSSAVRKSADIDTHLAAIENIEVLFQTGKITESKPDRDNDPNIKAVHRVHSQMGPYDVKFTVKELVQMEQGNRIYSIEAIETERASERKRDDADTLAGPTSSPQSEALSQDTLDMEESQTFSLTSQNALWHGITGYDKRGNPKTVVILGRQSSGAYSLSINGTLRDFDEAQTAAITGLPPGQLRTLSSGDASHEPVQMVEPPVAKQPDPTPADPPPKDGSKTQEPASDPSDKKHLTGTTEESISYKLRTYLLDPKHPEGGPKSVWFKGALGFTQSNVDDLGRQLVFDPQTAKTTKTTEFGQKFNQIISLKGANGKVISVTVCWIRNPDGVIRLVTILPEDK